MTELPRQSNSAWYFKLFGRRAHARRDCGAIKGINGGRGNYRLMRAADIPYGFSACAQCAP